MRISVTVIVLFALVPVAQAQDWFIFANDGQDQEQQDMDEFQCIRIARDLTDFDPMATPTAETSAPQTQGGAGRGALRGAALGTAVGAVTGDAGRGARRGAAAGGVMGGMRRADSSAQQQQWAQQEAANYQANRDNWTRAFSACMGSRGYTVG